MNTNGDYGIPVPDYIEENVSIKVTRIINFILRNFATYGLQYRQF